MFGYDHQNTRYITSTKPENGEYFLSVSLQDFPSVKHGKVRAVTLRYNLTSQVERLDQAIQDGASEAQLNTINPLGAGMFEKEPLKDSLFVDVSACDHHVLAARFPH